MTFTMTREQIRAEKDAILGSFVKGCAENHRGIEELAQVQGLTYEEAAERYNEALQSTFEDMLPVVKPDTAKAWTDMLEIAFEEIGFTATPVPGRYHHGTPQYKTLRLGAYRCLLGTLGLRFEPGAETRPSESWASGRVGRPDGCRSP